MKNLIACALLMFSFTAAAAAQPYAMRVQNPAREIGYIVGDIINRNIELDVKAPYKLASGSVPAKGISRKGIELRDVVVTEKKSSGMTHYRLQLRYQVFTSGANARKIELPKENLIITHAGKSIPAGIPAWRFRLSPIAAHGEVYIEEDMSPYRGPMLVDAGYLKPLLAAFLGMIVVSVFGLIYINADPAWFPGMGGPFASSYRQVSNLAASSLPGSPENTRKAVSSIHHAFNQTYGENVFGTDVETFLHKHPGFARIRHDIESFFNLSNAVLFGVKTDDLLKPDELHGPSLPALVKFCEQCRDCERGVA